MYRGCFPWLFHSVPQCRRPDGGSDAEWGCQLRHSYARALPRAWRRTARIFVALGDPHRQRILLMFEPGERLSVREIVAASTLSRTAVAHHLKVLREAGVLHSEKIGKEVWHRSDPEAVRAALTDALDFLDDQ